MPLLEVHNISYQFDDGTTLFTDISCGLTQHRTGLVGRNGVGKSFFADILTARCKPTNGHVQYAKSVAIYRQQAAITKQTIKAFLGLEKYFTAIEKIASGDCSQHWFDIINDRWDLADSIQTSLNELGVPKDITIPCDQLSGGQLAKLKLWQLFNSDVELLILDEPSNHLDRQAKQWLIAQMHAFSGAILLISHDRELLNEMQEIWQLSALGLSVYGGNYTAYAEQKRLERNAIERRLMDLDKQKRQLAAQAQRNREKAAQRAVQGKKLGKDGSQPKVLLDSKKDKATAGQSRQAKTELLRQNQLNEKHSTLLSKHEQALEQKFYFSTHQGPSQNVISVLDAQLAFGNSDTISFSMRSNDKLHLKGGNGTGKSTLLKTLAGQIALRSGEIRMKMAMFYLDQHFAIIKKSLTLLDNIKHCCKGVNDEQARTLLAGIGFRKNKVFQLASQLSGGEKMKLAMLIASQQHNNLLLLLDEPDNHLDIESKIILAEALKQYKGGFILVSHDRDFVREAGVNRSYSISL